MTQRQTHLSAARKHRRRAVAEIRHMAADSALHWILSHKDRVAQFRRAVRGTRAERPVLTLLEQIREEASTLRTRRPVKRKAVRHRRARPRKTTFAGLSLPMYARI